MRKTIRAGLASLMALTLILSAGACSSVKKQMVDNMLDRVKREEPLTQRDLEAVARMIRTKSTDVEMSDSRKIYALGKVATGLAREYSSRLAVDGIMKNVTVADILGLLDTVGLIKKGEYDYLLGVDLAIFDPLEQEARLISQNKTSLFLALAQLAINEGLSKR